jgi:4-amino-4-deoxy-L-arabinose transferase-like glycosyltransferase
MESQLTILLPVAALWLAAGAVADGLPRVDNTRTLRRRTGWLLVLALAGVALTAAVLTAGLLSAGTAPVDRAAGALALAAVPSLVVAVCTVRRLRRLRAGAGAFASAPGTPAPYGLRAAAAHPLIGLPVQVTVLTMVPALIVASGTDLGAQPALAGPAITVGTLAVTAIGVRHALRHNRFAERARPPAARSARAAGALHV